MRRIVAIFVLTLFLLNILGYYAVFMGLKIQTGKELTQRFDSSEDLAVQETITFKMPFALPGKEVSGDFERVDGEFEHDGDIYRLVKQRHYQDTLYLVCLKDEKSTRIQKAINELVNTFTDKTDGASKSTSVNPVLIKDFICTTVTLTNQIKGWEFEITPSSQLGNFNSSFFASFIHPPERA